MKEIIKKKTSPIIIKTNKFESILIRVVFPFVEDDDNIALNYLLSKTIKGTSNKYPDEESFKMALIDRYILNLGNGYSVVGNSGLFVYSMTIVDPHLLKENHLESAIKMMSEYIYKPRVYNGSFDEKIIDRHRKNVLIDIENSKKNLRGYINSRIADLIDNEGIYRRTVANYADELFNVNGKNLYQYYKKTIKEKTPFVFVIGNVDKKTITPLLNKYFNKNNVKSIECVKDFEHYLKPYRKEPQIITEKKGFNQSAVTLVYKVKDFKENDRIPLNIIKMLLVTPSTRLLYNKLRTQEQLVYSTDAYNNYFFGLLTIKAYTDKEKLEFAKDKVLELIEELKDVKTISNLLPLIVDAYKTGMLENQDDKYCLLDDQMDYFFEVTDLPQNVLKKYENIDTKEIISILSRLELDTIYYVKEEDHE